MPEDADRHCIWCGRRIEPDGVGYWCPSCDHSFGREGLTLDELRAYPDLYANRDEPHEPWIDDL